MKRARQFAVALAFVAPVIVMTSCSGLYTIRPRYSGRTAAARVRPVTEPVIPVKPLDPRQGKLSWPAPGPVTAEFGVVVEPKYGTKTRRLGIDIACAAGTPVKAVYAGNVSFADRFMGYGMTVIVDHGQRLHTVYSMLREVSAAVGVELKEGMVLGYADDTLHFQVRKEGQSVDPRQWLRPR
ncbi:MAG: peptidoglycan DD-metalloendopeptidase family protein [bacterium]